MHVRLWLCSRFLCDEPLIKMITVQSLSWHIKIWNRCMSQGLNQYPVVTNMHSVSKLAQPTDQTRGLQITQDGYLKLIKLIQPLIIIFFNTKLTLFKIHLDIFKKYIISPSAQSNLRRPLRRVSSRCPLMAALETVAAEYTFLVVYGDKNQFRRNSLFFKKVKIVIFLVDWVRIVSNYDTFPYIHILWKYCISYWLQFDAIYWR